MTTILIVEKSGSIKELSVKQVVREELYKKCSFRKKDGFEKRTTWKVKVKQENVQIELWSRDKGSHGKENKYDFPPPIDTQLYFGNCALVRIKDNTIVDLSKELWLKVYEILFGGFEDLDNSEEESEDELASVPKSMKTKNGYLKDGFVIDTTSDDDEKDEDYEEDDEEEENYNDEEDDDEDDEEEDEEEDEDDDEEEDEDDEEDDEEECENYCELSEEEYDYSDE